jgi:hypothetical protein
MALWTLSTPSLTPAYTTGDDLLLGCARHTLRTQKRSAAIDSCDQLGTTRIEVAASSRSTAVLTAKVTANRADMSGQWWTTQQQDCP